MNNDLDILVIEDEPVVIDAAKKILTGEHFRVDGVSDTATAVSKLQRNDYALILSDLMLPDVSGFEFIDHLRTNHPTCPLIVITGYATRDNAVKSFKLGAFDFVPKPFEIGELLGVVYRGLRYTGAIREYDKRGTDDNFAVRGPQPSDPVSTHYSLGRHSWARLDGDGSALIGLGQTFQGNLGEIQTVEFPALEEELSQGNLCVKITSADELILNAWAPLSGTVIEVNRQVEEDVNLIGSSPYYRDWLVRVIPANLESELEKLTRVEPDAINQIVGG